MGQKLKRWMCYAIIIVLLPYIATVFINGPDIMVSSHVDESYVSVKTEAGTAEMSVEEYCIGILAKEIPADYKKEALKAQAILVRTGVYGVLEKDGRSAVLTESFWTREQMEEAWGSANLSSNYAGFEKAWKETEGQVVVYKDKIAKTPFFRLSNGNTRDGKEVLGKKKYPYLKIVECPLDIEAPEQIQTVTVEDLDAEITKCDTAGYVLKVRVGNKSVSGEEFRKKYHLDSSCFTLQKYNGKLRITTRGIGHGLGLSQYTANEMAKEGKEASEILDYFFEGTELKEVADIVDTGTDETENKTIDE